ncbi:MAG: hypothetical protein ABI808_11230 [Pseudonocardiales bacterium]
MSPGKERSRPAGNEPATISLNNHSHHTAPASIPAQLRRRREASRREPTLFDGRHDPIDPEPGVGRRPITVELDRFSAHFDGPDGPIRAAIRAEDVQSMRSPRDKRISVPIDCASAVISRLRYGQGVVVYLTDSKEVA